MKAIKPYLPAEVEDLLALSPEELAARVLRYLTENRNPARGGPRRDTAVNLADFTLAARGEGVSAQYQYPQDRRHEVAQALLEAWSWLEREGLIAPFVDGSLVWHFVTRRGFAVARTEEAWQEFREARRLPRELLHPKIDAKAWPVYVRGEFAAAVFSALLEVEVAVREAAGFGHDLYGVDLVRRAFHPGDGKLADKSAPLAEQESLSHLFAGAIGSYKNPNSHRHLAISAAEAAEMIVLASHLLRIVDARRDQARRSA